MRKEEWEKGRTGERENGRNGAMEKRRIEEEKKGRK